MTREQLIDTLGKNGRRLTMKAGELVGFDFSGLDLTQADFRFADLRRANFRGAILRQADLRYANLSGADLTNADLYGANLNFCGLSDTNLTGANMEGASLNYAVGQGHQSLKKLPAEPITLTTILQKPGWGLMIGALLGALLIYGCNAVVFFTNLIVTAKDPVLVGLYRFLIIQNLSDGIVMFLLVWALSIWLARNVAKPWKRHLIVTVVVLISFFIVNSGIYYLIGKPSIDELRKRSEEAYVNAPWYCYVIGDLLVANFFLYILQQGRQMTRKLSEQEFQLLNLEQLKTRAELDALQAKINPHFLYNALNSIASLVHDDPDKAEEMTLLLSKLFRYSTGRDGELFASLADELEMVRTYLQVEKVRFGNRLTFTVDISNDALTSLRLPQFLLQPIVENAIKHGIAKRAESGRIDVRIYEKADYLHLCVHDNGPAFPDDMGGGYGLRSIQDKLNLLYGDDASVEFQNFPLKQVLISIRLDRINTPPFGTASSTRPTPA